MEALQLAAVYGGSSLAALWLARGYLLLFSRRFAAALLLLPLVLTGSPLLTGGFYGPLNLSYDSVPLSARRADLPWSEYKNGGLSDVAIQMVPWRKAVREAVKTGQAPLLNRFMLSGDILLASSQPGSFHPNTWIGFLLPLATAWTFACAFTLFLTGLFAFLFLRDLGVSERAAFFGTAAWTLSDHQIVFTGWANASVFAPLPLLLLGLRRLARGTPGGLGATSVALVLMLLAGHHESVLHVTAGAGVYFLFELASSRRRLPAVARSLLAGALALGISAAAILPFFEALPQTLEGPFRKEWYAKQKKSVSLEDSAAASLALFFPKAYGEEMQLPGMPVAFRHVAHAYLGGFALGLAALGFSSRRREKWGLAAAGLLALLVAIGLPGLSDVISKLPLFDISINGYLTGVTAFCLAALSALGFEQVEAHSTPGHAAILFLLATALGGFGLARHSLFTAAVDSDRAAFEQSVVWLVAPMLVFAVVGLRSRRRPLLSGAAIVLLLVSRAVEKPPLYLSFPSRLFYPDVPELERLPRAGEPYRTVGLGYALVPNQSALYELEDPRGYQAMTNARYLTTYPLWCVPQPVWFNRVDDATRPFLSFLNVRFAIAGREERVPAGWREFSRGESCAVFENPKALPRAFVPERVRFVPNPLNTIEEMRGCVDFSKLAWVEDAAETPREVENGGATVRTRRDGADLYLMICAVSPAWIVVSQTAWKGWKALRNGEPLPLRSANQAFLGLRVPAGDHRVRLAYRPDSFRIGLVISAVSIAVVAGALLIHRKRSRRWRAPRCDTSCGQANRPPRALRTPERGKRMR